MATATSSSHVEDPEAEQANYRKALRSYEKLLKLVRAGDGPAAERFWRSHLEAANELLMRGFESTAVIDILA
jgi:GntR family transcriptional regulator, transcriptional repressor for pyruvate dehydrogenase complex